MNQFDDKSLYILYGLITWGIYELRNFRTELNLLRRSIETVSKDFDQNLTKHTKNIETKLLPARHIIEKIDKIIK